MAAGRMSGAPLQDVTHLRTVAYANADRLRMRRALFASARPAVEPAEWALTKTSTANARGALDLGTGTGVGACGGQIFGRGG